jgi:ribosomal protein L37AE/L43A
MAKKIMAKKCPKCKDEVVVRLDGKTEVFECINCKFVTKKNVKKK